MDSANVSGFENVKPAGFTCHFTLQSEGYGLCLVSARHVEEACDISRRSLVKMGWCEKPEEVSFSEARITTLPTFNAKGLGSFEVGMFTRWNEDEGPYAEKLKDALIGLHQEMEKAQADGVDAGTLAALKERVEATRSKLNDFRDARRNGRA